MKSSNINNGVLIAAKAVLMSAEPAAKVDAAFALSKLWRTSPHPPAGGADIAVPDRPARPKRPELLAPTRMKRRRLGTIAGRAALMHAIAHIEFNAIDLAADIIARFGGHTDIDDEHRADFIRDWINVCDDEARHFSLVQGRLLELESGYGALPAHDGLWQAAQATKDNLMARLVIAPMVLEARGLDVTPAMIIKLRSAGDSDSADILQIIYDDEIGHVAAGSRWFTHICESQNRPKTQTFHTMVRTYYKGLLKPPFNKAARDLAGMPVDFYEPLSMPAALKIKDES